MTTDLTAPARPAAESHPVLVEEWDADLRSTDPLGFPGYRAPAADEESVVLHRDPARAAAFARASRIRPTDLLALGVADAVLPDRVTARALTSQVLPTH